MLFYRRRSWASLFVSPLLSLPRPYLHTRTNLLRPSVQDARFVGQHEHCALMILLLRLSAGVKRKPSMLFFLFLSHCRGALVFLFGVVHRWISFKGVVCHIWLDL